MTKSTSYRETFRRHRKLLCLPMILGIFIAAWSVLGSAKSYQSTVSLWVDTPASMDSSLGNVNPAIVPPAQQEQNVVTELLSTRSFVLSVGHDSALAGYLASHRSSGFSPSALFSSLGGAGSVDNRIIAALDPTQVTTTVAGPQVLQLSWKGPTPAVAASTLGALVTQLQQDSARFSQAHSQGAIAYYKAQVQAASQALTAARSQVGAYINQHPGAAAGDPNLTALQAAEGVASTQLTQANSNYTTAASTSKDSGIAASAVQVIDPPNVPTGPTSGKKKALIAILGGLFGGALISFLGVVALTRRKSSSLEDEDERRLRNEAPVAGPSPVFANGHRAAQSAVGTPRGLITGRRLAESPHRGEP